MILYVDVLVALIYRLILDRVDRALVIRVDSNTRRLLGTLACLPRGGRATRLLFAAEHEAMYSASQLDSGSHRLLLRAQLTGRHQS